MRFLLVRTDALGDLVVSLPVQERILSRQPGAEIHWLVSPYAEPLLRHQPEIAGLHLRGRDEDLAQQIRDIAPDAVLVLSHRDRKVARAAKAAGVPIRVVRARGLDQILAATHRIWKGRTGPSLHEAQHALDFLRPWGWEGGVPQMPRLELDAAELEEAHREFASRPRPQLGIFLRGSGSGAAPTEAWWTRFREQMTRVGWHSTILGPLESSELPGKDLRALMARMAACDAVVSPSTGPAHVAAALGVPTLVLMGLRKSHRPSRWTPMGTKVQVVQYPGPEADLGSGMDRLDPAEVEAHLARLLGARP